MTIVLLAAWLILALTTTPAVAAEMAPGLWEITVKMEAGGMQMPPQTVRHCYTKKDVADPKNMVPPADEGGCQIKDYRVKGDTVTWAVECKGENAMTGTGTMTMSATSYSGTMRAKMRDGRETMDAVQTWAGKRVGDCK